MSIRSVQGQQKRPSKLKALKPLLAATCLVLVLGGIRLHQSLSRDTKIHFSVLLENQLVRDYEAFCDGMPMRSGKVIPIGNHQLVVRHPKGETLRTNLFLFYGSRNLGDFNLKRAMGTLEISVNPVANSVHIGSEDFRTNLTKVSEFSKKVPTGDYVIDTQLPFYRNRQTVQINDGLITSLQIHPDLGALNITANVGDSAYQLVSQEGLIVQKGKTPAVVEGIPVGTYQIEIFHGSDNWVGTGKVEKDATNVIKGHFAYGSLQVLTEPPGAMVFENGSPLGRTPLVLHELRPRVYKLGFELEGYEYSKTDSLVIEGTTNSISTKLVRTETVRQMQQASRALESASFNEAIRALTTVLNSDPQNEKARAMLRTAQNHHGLELAETFANKGQFLEAIGELTRVLANDSDFKTARELLKKYEVLAAKQAEEARIIRLNFGKSLFTALCSNVSNTSFFDTLEIKTRTPVKEVESQLFNILNQAPRFTTKRVDKFPDAFVIEAELEMLTSLKTSAGKRTCLIVGAQINDNETQILFKVMEFSVEAVNKFSIGNALGTPVAVNYLPITTSTRDEKLLLRAKEGKQEFRSRILQAAGGEKALVR